jgi:hypothetical protein
MATTAILPQAAERPTVKALAAQLAAALGISEGRILQVMATPWSDGRVSYRVAVEQNSQLKTVHRLMPERQSVTVNDALWSLSDGLWTCRPAYTGAGFIAYHPDYRSYLRHETI